MQGGDVFNVHVRILLGFPEIDDLYIPFAFVTDINTVLLIAFHSEIGQGLLFLIAAERTFNSREMPFKSTLIAEQEASLSFPDLSDFGSFPQIGQYPSDHAN